MLLGDLQQGDGLSGCLGRYWIGQAGQGGHHPGRLGMQGHDGAGDDAQGALGPYEQVTQVIAGVVLAKAAQTVPDLAVGGDHFDAQTQGSGVAIAQHSGTARIGRQVAANGGRAPCGQVEREGEPHLVGLFLHSLHGDAGIDGDGLVVLVSGPNTGHARQVQDDLSAGVIGGGATGESGVAPLGDQGDFVRVGQAHQLGHLLRAAGKDHCSRLAKKLLPPVIGVGGKALCIGEDCAITEQFARLAEKGG